VENRYVVRVPVGFMRLERAVEIDFETLFAEADEVIEQSSRLTEQARSRRAEADRELEAYEAPSILPDDLDAQVALAGPQRWHTRIVRGH
jgi:hypothetical protein